MAVHTQCAPITLAARWYRCPTYWRLLRTRTTETSEIGYTVDPRWEQNSDTGAYSIQEMFEARKGKWDEAPCPFELMTGEACGWCPCCVEAE